MDVQDSVGESNHGLAAQDPHEPGQDQTLNAGSFGGIANLLGELGPITTIRHDGGFDRGLPGTPEGTASGDIAYDQSESWQAVVNEGLEVGARAAGENCEFDGELLEWPLIARFRDARFWLAGRAR